MHNDGKIINRVHKILTSDNLKPIRTIKGDKGDKGDTPIISFRINDRGELLYKVEYREDNSDG